MAWLLIDSSNRELFRAALIHPKGEIKERAVKGIRSSILSELHDMIQVSELPNLSGIAVVYGPGSFSAIRSGVLIANLLSRLYHLPLYGFSKEEAADLIDVRRKLSSNAVKPSAYISPLYDAEPNITQSVKS
jgi:tRNA A37 threonylcarbamoyladenosine modification protein TsaB